MLCGVIVASRLCDVIVAPPLGPRGHAPSGFRFTSQRSQQEHQSGQPLPRFSPGPLSFLYIHNNSDILAKTTYVRWPKLPMCEKHQNNAARNGSRYLVPFFHGHGTPQLSYRLHSIRLRVVDREQDTGQFAQNSKINAHI